MTPKEKAGELVDKYAKITQWKMGLDPRWVVKQAKRCALTAVDEILDVVESNLGSVNYWEKVKHEIETL